MNDLTKCFVLLCEKNNVDRLDKKRNKMMNRFIKKIIDEVLHINFAYNVSDVTNEHLLHPSFF